MGAAGSTVAEWTWFAGLQAVGLIGVPWLWIDFMTSIGTEVGGLFLPTNPWDDWMRPYPVPGTPVERLL
jgi:hypothetical protein